MENKNTLPEHAWYWGRYHLELSKNVVNIDFEPLLTVNTNLNNTVSSGHECLFFVFPITYTNKKQNIKRWKAVGMHVLHIVTEMLFWVVEFHVIKKINKFITLEQKTFLAIIMYDVYC